LKKVLDRILEVCFNVYVMRNQTNNNTVSPANFGDTAETIAKEIYNSLEVDWSEKLVFKLDDSKVTYSLDELATDIEARRVSAPDWEDDNATSFYKEALLGTDRELDADEALETLTYALSLWENGSFSYAEKEIVSLFDLPVDIGELQEQAGEEASDPLEFERFVSRTLFRIAKNRIGA
jgi:glycerol-3-phosphate O-acyltransferase